MSLTYWLTVLKSLTNINFALRGDNLYLYILTECCFATGRVFLFVEKVIACLLIAFGKNKTKNLVIIIVRTEDVFNSGRQVAEK